jgi:hypothetical protein
MGINTGWGGGGGGASSFSQLTGTLANTQIPNSEIGIAKLNATGTPGASTFLRGDGAWALASSGSTPFKSDSVTVGNTKTTLQLTDLDLNTDKRYEISGTVAQNGAGSVTYYLRANGDATNLATLHTLASGGSFQFDLSVQFHEDTAGLIYGAIFVRSEADRSQAPVYTAAITNLTSVEIVASTADKIGQYSYVDCWKMTGVGEQGPQGEAGPAGSGVARSSVLRFTAFQQKGSTNGFIMQIPAPAETDGETDLFTVTNSTANGGYITVSEACKVDVAWAGYNFSGAAQPTQIMIGANLVNTCNQSEAECKQVGFVNHNSYPVFNAGPFWLEPGQKLFFTTPFTPNNSNSLLNTLVIGATY